MERMVLTLLWHEIRSRRNAIVGWALGLTSFALMYTLVYPDVEAQMADLADLAIYQAMGIELASFEGYLGSTVIGFVPLLLGVYAIMAATTTLAGEEESGTLELLLTTRLSRWQLVTAKAGALLIVLLLILLLAALGNMLGFTLIADKVSTRITQADVFRVVLSALPLVWALAMIGLWLGSWLPTRRLALMAGLLVLLASYFGENLAGMVEATEWLQPFSLFTYFDAGASAFSEGIDAGNVITLLIVGGIAFALALVSFERRDVTVGAWPWQRAQLPD